MFGTEYIARCSTDRSFRKPIIMPWKTSIFTLIIVFLSLSRSYFFSNKNAIIDRGYGYDQNYYADRFYDRGNRGYASGGAGYYGGYYDNRNYRPYDDTYRWVFAFSHLHMWKSCNFPSVLINRKCLISCSTINWLCRCSKFNRRAQMWFRDSCCAPELSCAMVNFTYILHYFCHPSAARPSRKFSDSLNRMFVALSSIAKPTLVEKKELIIIGKFVKWNTTCVTLCGSLDIIREMMLKLFVYRCSIDNDNCVLAKKRRSERFNFILKLNRTKSRSDDDAEMFSRSNHTQFAVEWKFQDEIRILYVISFSSTLACVCARASEKRPN